MSRDEETAKLLRHLRQEFGDEPVEFLLTAKYLLEQPQDANLRLANSAAYCMRECLERLLATARIGPPTNRSWRALSRDLVTARHLYGATAEQDDSGREGTLEKVLDLIDEIEASHDEADKHERRLAAVILNRTGIKLSSSRTASRLAERFMQVQKSLNAVGVHGVYSFEASQKHLTEVLDVLRGLFAPHELRLPDLERLAALDSPQAADLVVLLDSVVTPHHQTYFFERAISWKWLPLLETQLDLVAPPSGNATWPLIAFFKRLQDEQQQHAAKWLAKAARPWLKSTEQAPYVALAGDALGESGNPILLSVLGTHRENPSVTLIGVRRLLGAPANSSLVELLAERLLNPTGGLSRNSMTTQVVDRIAAGVNPENWAARLSLLFAKLAETEPADRARRFALQERAGSIADPQDLYPETYFPVLLGGLISAIRATISLGVEGAGIEAMLGGLPGDVRDRLVTWLLGETDSFPVDRLLDWIRESIENRSPCGDDLRLIDRVVSDLADDQYVGPWSQALGTPQPIEVIGAQLANHELPERVFELREWSGILPAECSTAWNAANTVINSAYGVSGRERFTQRMEVVGGVGHSPFEISELEDLSIDTVIEKVASWRPQPTDFLVGAVELARVLEDLVKRQPQAWAEMPLRVVSGLHHPTYITHYFRGLGQSDTHQIQNAESLIEAIAFCRQHPWEAITLGDRYDFEADWLNTDVAGVALIQQLANADSDFGNGYEKAWEIAISSANDRSNDSGISGDGVDYLSSAINRPCTRALETVFALMGHEYRSSGSIRPAALGLLDEALQLLGTNGAQHRAILGSRFPFLLTVAKDWVEQNADLLFGKQVPDSLGRITADAVITWTRPQVWFLERQLVAIVDAIKREVRNASHFLAIGLLWECEGYELANILERLVSADASMLSTIGETLGRLLRTGDPELRHLEIAVSLWEQVLKRANAGALAGFGWYSEIMALQQPDWLRLTLETLKVTGGRIDWAHNVAERAILSPLSETSLLILDALVRGLVNDDDWDRFQVVEIALGATSAAPSNLRDTDGYKRLKSSLVERGYFDS